MPLWNTHKDKAQHQTVYLAKTQFLSKYGTKWARKSKVC